MSKVMILGATSAIAMETAKCFAEAKDEMFLVARDETRLKTLSDDLLARGAPLVCYVAADLADTSLHAALFKRGREELQGLDTVYIAYGTLSDQKACEANYENFLKEFHNNFLSVASLLTIAANEFAERKQGCIAVISSVAGDRGRQSNYVYGTAKGALSIFLQGLRNRLEPLGVSVITIKPGFVDTPMTAGIKKGPLFASAQQVGAAIYRKIKARADVVYLPWFWRYIMQVIKLIPEPIFKRLKL